MNFRWQLFAVCAVLAVVVIALTTAAGKPQHVVLKEQPILWVGHPVVSDNRAVEPTSSWLADHQIGFRADGVVVWRKVGPKKK